MKQIIILVLLLFLTNCYGEGKRVLFLGNSYIYYNDLPLLVSTLSKSAGKDLIVESNSLADYTIQDHLTNMKSLKYIREGNWDYVVIQEQSQIPTIDYYRYNSMYPSMTALSDTIRKYNPCAVIISYMTWGRRNGGLQCDLSEYQCSPDFRDFSHMQDSLEGAYVEISNRIKATIAPVGIAWKKVIENSKYELHGGDFSHPNYRGSYLAACVFYGIIHNDSPINIKNNIALNQLEAEYLRIVADQVVSDDKMKWNSFYNYPIADFDFSFDGATVIFKNLTLSPDNVSYYWDFGDGNTSSDLNPTHKYDSEKTYEVKLKVKFCGKAHTVTKQVNVSSTYIQDNRFKYFLPISPNPTSEFIHINLDKCLKSWRCWTSKAD